MFFDDLTEEKKLYEDIQFKRRAVFTDDDDVLEICIEPFSRSNQDVDLHDQGCQINIQNELVSIGAQTRSKKHREVQTELVERDIEDNMKSSDMDRLTRLLTKRVNLIEEALYENNRSAAFTNYEVDWAGGGATITNPFVLTYQQLVKEQELQATCVAWNSSGTTVCVAYGRLDHEAVCTHRAGLATWNIDRLKINVNKPDVVIETDCCVSVLTTHPEYPGIIAVGLFNGDIQVYDIRQPDPLVASILEKNELHTDEVTSLKWIKDAKTSKKKYLLLSGSRDGKMLIWNALPAKNQLKLVDGFLLLIDYLPKHKTSGTEMGVSAISINSEDKDTFLVGSDSGGLFKCSLSAELPATTNVEEEFVVQLKSPVQLVFDVQHGPIYSISSSPFHRNLFLTCGTDSEIKLYSLLQTISLVNFCPDDGYLYCIEWSSSRPCVFACGTHKGNILIYDLMEASVGTRCQIAHASEKPVVCIAFNEHRAGYLASGDSAGVVKIWRLSHDLTRAHASEMQKLNEISEKPFEKN